MGRLFQSVSITAKQWIHAMLYKHQSAPPQLRHHCRNPRCAGKLKIPTTNTRDAFCCKGCERQFYGCRCRVCEALFARKTRRRNVCWRSHCRHEFQRHPELYFGLRYPSARLGHNASRKAIKLGTKIGAKCSRALRIVAGPEVHEINLRIPAEVPASKADKAFEDYWRSARRRAARCALTKRHTPPVNIIGGYQFPGAPKVDLSTPSASPPVSVGADVGLGIPSFLRRTQTEGEPT
jgi:hypothetical protein